MVPWSWSTWHRANLGPKLLPPRMLPSAQLRLPCAQLRLLPLHRNLFELLHHTLGGLLLHKGAGAVDPPGPLPLPLPLAQLMLMQYCLLGLMHQFPAVQGCRSTWCTRPLPLLLPPLPPMQLHAAVAVAPFHSFKSSCTTMLEQLVHPGCCCCRRRHYPLRSCYCCCCRCCCRCSATSLNCCINPLKASCCTKVLE